MCYVLQCVCSVSVYAPLCVYKCEFVDMCVSVGMFWSGYVGVHVCV